MTRNQALNRSWPVLLALLLLLATPLRVTAQGSAVGENAYITNLSITVRRGPGIDYKIIAFLRPGQGVEALGRQSGWRQIRFDEDRTGWVLERYLTDTPSITSQAKELLDENERLKSFRTVLEKSNSSLRSYFDNPIQNAPAEVKQKTHTPQELARALNLGKQLLKKERARVQGYRERRMIEDDLHMWFLIGAGMAGVGMVLGVLTQRSRRWFKRKS